ncbi:hypothetical protein [Spiroplasma endosymbiont of Dioctria linearis]|uniref:hypothetical protein n=1 Tax=Spiroplasma endosymbiont of Dioctria linearis TaxID=3066290 RepID=UPI00313B42F5
MIKIFKILLIFLFSITNSQLLIKTNNFEYHNNIVNYKINDDVEYVISEINKFKYPKYKFNTYITGSNARNTNISNSDWDINVRINMQAITNEYLFSENEELLVFTNPKYKIPNEEKTPFDFKNYKSEFFEFKFLLNNFLKTNKNFYTTLDNKVIKLVYKNEEYDIAPTFEYKFKAENNYYSGSSLIGQLDAKMYLNFDSIMVEKFNERDKQTNGRFTQMVRDTKTVKSQNNISGSSIGFENLLFYINNSYLTKDKYVLKDIQEIMKYIDKNYMNDYDSLLAVDNIMLIKKFLPYRSARNIIDSILNLNEKSVHNGYFFWCTRYR